MYTPASGHVPEVEEPADVAEVTDKKKKKFQPLKAVRRFFRGNRKDKSGSKARSYGELGDATTDDDDDDEGGFKKRSTRLASTSEDSIFTSVEAKQPRRLHKSAAMSTEGIDRTAIEASPLKSTSRDSDLSIDGSENEDVDFFSRNWESSVASVVQKPDKSHRFSVATDTATDIDLGAVQRTSNLNTSLAKHRILIKPTQRRLPQRAQKQQRVSVASGLPQLREESPSKTTFPVIPPINSKSTDKKDESKSPFTLSSPLSENVPKPVAKQIEITDLQEDRIRKTSTKESVTIKTPIKEDKTVYTPMKENVSLVKAETICGSGDKESDNKYIASSDTPVEDQVSFPSGDYDNVPTPVHTPKKSDSRVQGISSDVKDSCGKSSIVSKSKSQEDIDSKHVSITEDKSNSVSTPVQSPNDKAELSEVFANIKHVESREKKKSDKISAGSTSDFLVVESKTIDLADKDKVLVTSETKEKEAEIISTPRNVTHRASLYDNVVKTDMTVESKPEKPKGTSLRGKFDISKFEQNTKSNDIVKKTDGNKTFSTVNSNNDMPVDAKIKDIKDEEKKEIDDKKTLIEDSNKNLISTNQKSLLESKRLESKTILFEPTNVEKATKTSVEKLTDKEVDKVNTKVINNEDNVKDKTLSNNFQNKPSVKSVSYTLPNKQDSPAIDKSDDTMKKTFSLPLNNSDKRPYRRKTIPDSSPPTDIISPDSNVKGQQMERNRKTSFPGTRSSITPGTEENSEKNAAPALESTDEASPPSWVVLAKRKKAEREEKNSPEDNKSITDDRSADFGKTEKFTTANLRKYSQDKDKLDTDIKEFSKLSELKKTSEDFKTAANMKKIHNEPKLRISSSKSNEALNKVQDDTKCQEDILVAEKTSVSPDENKSVNNVKIVKRQSEIQKKITAKEDAEAIAKSKSLPQGSRLSSEEKIDKPVPSTRKPALPSNKPKLSQLEDKKSPTVSKTPPVAANKRLSFVDKSPNDEKKTVIIDAKTSPVEIEESPKSKVSATKSLNESKISLFKHTSTSKDGDNKNDGEVNKGLSETRTNAISTTSSLINKSSPGYQNKPQSNSRVGVLDSNVKKVSDNKTETSNVHSVGAKFGGTGKDMDKNIEKETTEAKVPAWRSNLKSTRPVISDIKTNDKKDPFEKSDRSNESHKIAKSSLPSENSQKDERKNETPGRLSLRTKKEDIEPEKPVTLRNNNLDKKCSDASSRKSKVLDMVKSYQNLQVS